MPFFLFLLLLLSTPAFCQDEKESFWEKLAYYHDVVNSIVQGSLDSRGMSPDTLFRPNTASWESIAQDIDKELNLARCSDTDCESYESDLASVANTVVAKADALEILPNLRSFELRKELITKAERSIHIFVWGIYDDETGTAFATQLLDVLARNPDIDIRIVVDGNMANLKGRKILKALDKKSLGKIKIMKWKSKKYRANGNHRKMLIVDGKDVIVGGMNIGNVYSHLATDKGWRDVDIYIKGEKAAEVAGNQFAKIWNRQIVEFPKLEKKLGMMATIETDQVHEGTSVIFVDQHPGSAVENAYHNIHTSIVKLLRDSKETVDIENAYFIMDPIIKKEIEKVIKRGVKVRIYTNSDKSVDEALVSMPVMHSARDAVTMGAKVYLRTGTTLHSKYMIIDKKITMIGSFNLHPRSLRFDAENVAVVFDNTFAEKMTSHFEEGITEAKYFDDPKLFKIDWTLIGLLTKSFYFDFL